MIVDKQRVIELLGAGVSNEQTASAVGCDQSYVSQLMADESFAAKVVALRVAALTENTARDKKINSAEDELIDQLEDMISIRAFSKPRDLLTAFAVINKAQRRGIGATEAMTINQTIVNLQLPPAVVRNFTKNQQGEIIEVEGQTLVTMPAHQLLKNLVQKAGDNHEQYAKISRHLPSAIEHGIAGEQLSPTHQFKARAPEKEGSD